METASNPPLLQQYQECYLDRADSMGPKRSLEEAVREELNLSCIQEPAELEQLRRKFAYKNHPDRPGISDKPLALHRMTIANNLIDRAVQQARSRRPRQF